MLRSTPAESFPRARARPAGLDTGGHAGAFNDLMANGTVLTAAQCDTMAANLDALFGDAEVPDPGPLGA